MLRPCVAVLSVLAQVEPDTEMKNFFENNTLGKQLGRLLFLVGILLAVWLVGRFVVSMVRMQTRWLPLLGAALSVLLVMNLEYLGLILAFLNVLLQAAVDGVTEFMES